MAWEDRKTTLENGWVVHVTRELSDSFGPLVGGSITDATHIRLVSGGALAGGGAALFNEGGSEDLSEDELEKAREALREAIVDAAKGEAW